MEELFWELAARLMLEEPRVRESTIMGGRCLRVGEEFLALSGFREEGLILKLPRARVARLIEEGVGVSFAPAGKIFKEWVRIPEPNSDVWYGLLLEGVAFVG